MLPSLNRTAQPASTMPYNITILKAPAEELNVNEVVTEQSQTFLPNDNFLRVLSISSLYSNRISLYFAFACEHYRSQHFRARLTSLCSPLCIVLISASGIDSLQGFLFEARAPGNPIALGGWNNLNEPNLTQTLDCNGVNDSALTNTDNLIKSDVLANYTVPEDVNLSVIEFWCAYYTILLNCFKVNDAK